MGKPVKAAAYDYYRMERRVTRSLSFDEADLADDVCQVCGTNCAGCPGPQFGEWEMVEGCNNVCDDGSTSLWRRNCMDISRGTILPMNKCNLGPGESFEERRACSAPDFPECPAFHNGLWERARPAFSEYQSSSWRDLPYMYLIDGVGCERHPRGSEGYGKLGIPATYLGQQNGNVIPYIECGAGVSTQVSPSLSIERDIAALTDDGFTLSFLLFVEEFSKRPKTQQLVTFGQPKMLPSFSFEKSYWRSKVSFRVRHYRHQYRVKDISSRQLEGKWTHVLLTFNADTGAQVYFDGEQQGRAVRYNMRSPIIPKPFASYQLFYGKDNYGGSRGGVNAWVSSMDYWTRKFNAEEVQQVYSYFEPMIHPVTYTESGSFSTVPVLSPLNWRQFAVQGTSKCYNEEMTLYDMASKIENGDNDDGQCFSVGPCDFLPAHDLACQDPIVLDPKEEVVEIVERPVEVAELLPLPEMEIVELLPPPEIESVPPMLETVEEEDIVRPPIFAIEETEEVSPK